MTMTTQPTIRLRTATASKLGLRSEGRITYLVLASADRRHLFIALAGNDGGGYFSQEAVPLAALQRCLPTDRKLPFPAKALASAFVGRSSCNSGFMAAVLRSEGLTRQSPEKTQQHLAAGDWDAWKHAQLALTGEPYVPPAPATGKGKPVEAAVDPDTAATPPEPSGEPGDAVVEPPKVTRKDRGRKGKAAATTVAAPVQDTAPEPASTPKPEATRKTTGDAPPSIWAMLDGDGDAPDQQPE